VPLLPGSGLLMTTATPARSRRIGYPVMLKSTAGGGGIGMRLIWSEDELARPSPRWTPGAANFKEAGIFLEKYVEQARHIEVQIFGDGQGRCLALGERDCSVQRRNQKVIEETPAPGLSAAQRAACWRRRAPGQAVNYRSAGTVEFVYDADSGAFYFLEVNTRLQVEHGVTEEVTGVDLVEWMVRSPPATAPGPLPAPQPRAPRSRCASTPKTRQELPALAGLLTEVRFPTDVRVDTWVETGSEVPPTTTRCWPSSSSRRRRPAKPPPTKLHRRAGRHPRRTASRPTWPTCARCSPTTVFRAGRQTTRYLGTSLPPRHHRRAGSPACRPRCRTGRAAPATGTSACRPPARWTISPCAWPTAWWATPKARPAWNAPPTGPTLRFNMRRGGRPAGADHGAAAGWRRPANWQAHAVKAGSVLKLGAVKAPGCAATWPCRAASTCRTTWAAATFTLGQFGGHAAARCAWATCCIQPTTARPPGTQAPTRYRPPHHALGNRRALRPARRAGLLHRPDIEQPSSPPTGRCTTTPAAPACA
jgi:urea carboxylase